jgi:hypothetical protein
MVLDDELRRDGISSLTLATQTHAGERRFGLR